MKLLLELNLFHFPKLLNVIWGYSDQSPQVGVIKVWLYLRQLLTNLTNFFEGGQPPLGNQPIWEGKQHSCLLHVTEIRIGLSWMDHVVWMQTSNSTSCTWSLFSKCWRSCWAWHSLSSSSIFSDKSSDTYVIM